MDFAEQALNFLILSWIQTIRIFLLRDSVCGMSERQDWEKNQISRDLIDNASFKCTLWSLNSNEKAFQLKVNHLLGK